jgi:hypothetical protein
MQQSLTLVDIRCGCKDMMCYYEWLVYDFFLLHKTKCKSSIVDGNGTPSVNYNNIYIFNIWIAFFYANRK